MSRPNNVKQSTTIDHIWHNSKDSPKSYTLQTDISDHFLCVLSLETPRPSPVQKVISYRSVSNNRKASFLLHIRNTDFSYVNKKHLSLDIKFDRFMQEFYASYDNYFPIRHKKISEKKSKKWLAHQSPPNLYKRKTSTTKKCWYGTFHQTDILSLLHPLKKTNKKIEGPIF